jgi:hypothetical protein
MRHKKTDVWLLGQGQHYCNNSQEKLKVLKVQMGIQPSMDNKLFTRSRRSSQTPTHFTIATSHCESIELAQRFPNFYSLRPP